MDQDIFKKDNEYIVHTYQHFPIAVRCGHGASAEDFDGKTYVDFGSGIGTNSLGFCNESWVDAVSEQLRKVQHTSNLFYTLPDVLLAERLCRETGYSKVFFCNSGAEVSGLGLMIGVRLEERMDAKLVASRCAENGLMILTAKTKLRIMPPLNITMDEIDRGLNVLRGCLSGLGDRDETKKNKL